MLFTSYLIGLVVLAVGVGLKICPPENIGNVYGYRTPFAMLNKDVWDEANYFCSNMLIYIGIICLIISALCDIIYKNNIDIASKISTIISVTIIVCSVPSTEIHLRKTFDKYGNKRM
ncbi:SdpI family protein [Clostridium coskatii]|uniref:SdpI/YhfL protein family protein n=1 Tax=Clostridium coskatii TaxID=1705578 RepID=A0A166SX63_9CLOT|nr:SdpI family protein [Clostridium coskatii]OAA92891.1 hypothetical protein WX73_00560 [Clostridium coskatii]OBR95833.1 hypothetical protein CLCOS_12660 [Clostridium coskatii]